MSNALLEVRNLSVDFHTARGTVHAVRHVSWSVNRGETLAILGESGSGKSVSANAVMNILDRPPASVRAPETPSPGARAGRPPSMRSPWRHGCR